MSTKTEEHVEAIQDTEPAPAATVQEAVVLPTKKVIEPFSRREIFPQTNVDAEIHETTSEAIVETNVAIATAKQAVRERNKWAYKMTDEPIEDVVGFFGKEPGTHAVEGTNTVGRRLVAVWNGAEGTEPDTEPYFD